MRCLSSQTAFKIYLGAFLPISVPGIVFQNTLNPLHVRCSNQYTSLLFFYADVIWKSAVSENYCNSLLLQNSANRQLVWNLATELLSVLCVWQCLIRKIVILKTVSRFLSRFLWGDRNKGFLLNLSLVGQVKGKMHISISVQLFLKHCWTAMFAVHMTFEDSA